MSKLLLVLLFVPTMLFSQKKNNIFKWSTIAAAGLTAGQAGGKPVFQLSSGVNYHRFFTGIGAGYDNYEFRTIPLFADWRWRFGSKQAGFVYAIGGYNFPVNNEEISEWAKTRDDLKPAFYFDLGLGGGIPVGKSNRLLLSVGFSRKEVRQWKVFSYPCFTGDCQDDIYRLKYSFGRMTAKLSWELEY